MSLKNKRADSAIPVPIDLRSQTHETNHQTSLELVGEEHWLFGTLCPGRGFVLHTDIILKQFSHDIYCPPARLLRVLDIFFLALYIL